MKHQKRHSITRIGLSSTEIRVRRHMCGWFQDWQLQRIQPRIHDDQTYMRSANLSIFKEFKLRTAVTYRDAWSEKNLNVLSAWETRVKYEARL